MAMEKIEFAKAKVIAEKKGLKPGKVKGTNGIQFTNETLMPHSTNQGTPGKEVLYIVLGTDSFDFFKNFEFKKLYLAEFLLGKSFT